jgi:ATP-dependent Clp protease protease subunit
MDKLTNDFNRYLKSRKINDEYKKYYFQNILSYSDSPNVFDKILNNRIIIISGEIDDYLGEMVKANLLYLESLNNKLDVNIYINSVGGSIYSGLGLIDVMDFIEPDIVTINTGLAASMAAVILCCGTKGKRKALKRSRVMIHQPLGYGGWLQQASDLEIEAKEINSLKKELYEIISEKTNRDFERVSKDGDRNYWMNATEAKDYGMIDDIILKRF